MERQTKRILTIAICLVTCAMFSGAFYAPNAQGQVKGTIATKSDVWSASYHVSVRGDFKVEPELGKDGDVVTYHIDRVYDGSAKMSFLHIPSRPVADIVDPQFKDEDARVHITINDSRQATSDPLCGEWATVDETWKGEVWSWVGGSLTQRPAGLLKIDNGSSFYQTFFPLIYMPTDPRSYEIEHNKTITIHKNGGGQEVKTLPPERLPILLYECPSVKGFIERYGIMRKGPWSELKFDQGFFTWLSEVLHPDEPLISGVPDSKDKVNILIWYAIKKEK